MVAFEVVNGNIRMKVKGEEEDVLSRKKVWTVSKIEGCSVGRRAKGRGGIY